MKSNKKIINILNKLLAYDLTSRDQYFIHSQIYDDWGFSKLYDRIHHEMEEETGHCTKLISRILFLEGTPEVYPMKAPNVGTDVSSMLKNDLESEMVGIALLREAITICEAEQDYGTRTILESLLEDSEEDHLYWLEKQLGLIEKVGLANYLQTQVGANSH